MASTVQKLATRVALICLREIETAVDVVQETLLGCKVERREPARLSVPLTLFLLGTGLRTKDKGCRQRRLAVTGLVLLLYVFGWNKREGANRFVSYAQAGAADMGWASMLRFALPRMRKFLIEQQDAIDPPPSPKATTKANEDERKEVEESDSDAFEEELLNVKSIRIVKSTDSIPELNIAPGAWPVRPRLIRRTTSVASTLDLSNLAAMRQAWPLACDQLTPLDRLTSGILE
ncbi:uncharacterized protein RHO25_012110 [Cercospora beticola]|uniref:Uncharacterized protein n=1 Tax=Cercospora beticola TaxID=122368 RepID=A0ABZ0P6D6_CERBT|nr:hypothetical protein RHO25_012110 [Cercospora beticola]